MYENRCTIYVLIFSKEKWHLFISLSNICISWKYNIQVRNCFLYCIHDIFVIITKVFLYSPAVQWAIFLKQNLRFRLFWASSSVKIPVIMLPIMIRKLKALIESKFEFLECPLMWLEHLWQLCPPMMSWVQQWIELVVY